MGTAQETKKEGPSAGARSGATEGGAQQRGPMSEGGFDAGHQAASPKAQAASAELAAEIRRLGAEMRKLAQRNAWSGVERAYQQLKQLSDDLDGEIYSLAAQSARTTGDARQTQQRLRKAKTAGYAAAEQDLEAMEGQFASVILNSETPRPKSDKKAAKEEAPTLTREAMPFSPDQRKAIEFAQEKMGEDWSFSGLLPLGEYTLAHHDRSQTFKVFEGAKVNLIV